jgi:hypothetical protein
VSNCCTAVVSREKKMMTRSATVGTWGEDIISEMVSR